MRIGHKLTIPLIIISLGNLVEGLSRNYELSYFITNVLVFILFVPVLLLIFPKRENDKFMSISLLIFSCIGAWVGDYTDINCVLLLIFSIHISGIKRRTHIIYVSIFTTALTIKYSWLGLNIPQLLVFSSGVSALLILYYHYMAQGEVNNTHVPLVIDPCDINRDVVDIVQLRVQGLDWWQINDKLIDMNVTDDTIRRKVTKERVKHGFNNQESFVLYLVDKGLIRSNSLEENTGSN